jgi:hypothetical protein
VGTVDELAHNGLGVATEAEHWRVDGHRAAPHRGMEEDGRRLGCGGGGPLVAMRTGGGGPLVATTTREGGVTLE